MGNASNVMDRRIHIDETPGDILPDAIKCKSYDVTGLIA